MADAPSLVYGRMTTEGAMDGLDARRRASEEAWVRSEERRVRLRAARDVHLANAAAARLGMTPAEAGAFAASVAAWRPSDGAPRDAGLVAHVRDRLSRGGVDAGLEEVARMLREAEAAAARGEP